MILIVKLSCYAIDKFVPFSVFNPADNFDAIIRELLGLKTSLFNNTLNSEAIICYVKDIYKNLMKLFKGTDC